MNTLTNVDLSLRSREPLDKHSSFHIGGPALFFAEPQTREHLKQSLLFAKQEGLPWIVVGRGSNLLFPDEGYAGLVISMRHFMKGQLAFEADELEVSCGMDLSDLILTCQKEYFGGLEFLAGIPGTVGGALVQNAGICHVQGHRREIGEQVVYVNAINGDGEDIVFKHDDLFFGYRHSVFQGKGLILLSCRLKGYIRSSDDIKSLMDAHLEYRRSHTDLSSPSAGSVFRNPEGISKTAGELIDKAGLKGYRIGGAEVSTKHGNFIVNRTDASARDVRDLIGYVRSQIQDKFGINLELELEVVEPNL